MPRSATRTLRSFGGLRPPHSLCSPGEDKDIDIPGLSVTIPYINVNAGIVLDVSVGGNAESLSLKVGIDACAQLPVVGKQCGSKLTSDLPIWLIKETYAFGSLCKSADNQGTQALRASAVSIA